MAAVSEGPSGAEGGRTAIVVLGMHRTGTSAISGVLNLLGAAAPKSLMGPRPSNAKGNWESRAVMRLNDRILEASGSHWRDWGAFADRIAPELRSRFEAEIADVLAAEFGSAPLMVLKDPRLCRLMPLWLRALARAEIEARFVVPLRNPLEAAQSLLARNGIPIQEGLLLWLRYMLEAERATRGARRCFVPFQALLDDWSGVVHHISRRLEIRWPISMSLARTAIEQYVTPGLRHHSTPLETDTTGTLDWVPAANRLLMKLVEADSSSTREELDEIRREFDRVSSHLAPLYLQKALQAEAFETHRQQLERDLVGARVAWHKAEWENRRARTSTLGRILGKCSIFARKRRARSDREAELADLLLRSGLFDPEWYCKTYPDVRTSELEPAIHYLRFGAIEDRDPSPRFSAVAYRRRYPGVSAKGFNPLVHYLKFGIHEQRKIGPGEREAHES